MNHKPRDGSSHRKTNWLFQIELANGGEVFLSKDKAIGGAIVVVCVLVALVYLVTLFYPQWLSVFGMQVQWLSNAQFWVIAIPVFIAFTAVMGIGAWIGWTMATTPPPKPIEEITSEIETEEPKEKQSILS
jgi:predicted DNA-binding transcriptional regulator